MFKGQPYVIDCIMSRLKNWLDNSIPVKIMYEKH